MCETMAHKLHHLTGLNQSFSTSIEILGFANLVTSCNAKLDAFHLGSGARCSPCMHDLSSGT
jgi:hypothetical protein